MKQNLLLIFMLAISLAGCGSKSNNSSASSELQTFEDFEMLKIALDKHTVVCGEAGLTCPSYTAKLVFWTKASNNQDYNLGVCSGSLYKGKYIITNSHCIPKEVARSGTGCGDHIKAVFPTTKYYDADEAKCKSIVQVYNPSEDQPDIAVIELDRTLVRDSVEISKDSFIEGSNVSAFTMNPDASTVGTILKKTCTLSTDNALFMSASPSSGKALISGPACDIVGGNSGSALLKNGKMIGVVFARFDVPGLTKVFEENGINFTGKGFLGIAQNITCLNNIATSAGINCASDVPQISNFNDFLERAKAEHNLAAVNESQIEYEMNLSLKLKLKEVRTPQTSKSLTAFKENWTKILFNNSNSSQASIVFKSVLKK